MKTKMALIFGYNDYALEIGNNIRDKYDEVVIYSLHREQDSLNNRSNFEIRSFDLSDHWEGVSENVDFENSIAFCVLEDNAENIFLTISLRSLFSQLHIIALSNNKETANKLQMAGANRVIPLVQTTAEMISEMLEKPIVKEVFHSILFDSGELKITQIKLNASNDYLGKEISQIDWKYKFGVIPLAIVHEDTSSDFIYSSKIRHHTIKEGDMFVIVGYETCISDFEKVVGGRCDVNWCNWSR